MKALDDLPDLLTADEARAVLRIGRNQLYQAVREGSIPAVRIGRTVRIPRAALAAMLAGPDPPSEKINPPEWGRGAK